MKKLFLFLFSAFTIFSSANAAEGDYIIKYHDNAPMFFSRNSATSLGAGMYLVSEQDALALEEAGMLDICEPDRKLTYYEGTPNDTLYSSQWNLPKIKAEYAWSLKTFGNNVLVGVVDSGLDSDHPDLDYTRILEGYNFYNSANGTADTVGHGTAVSGIIAAKRNNSLDLCGISDKVKLIPLKCDDEDGNAYVSAMANAIMAGAGYFGCDVITISLGHSEDYESLKNAVNYALDLGCIIVAAVGNNTASDTGNHLRYPAAYEGVIGVGSTTQSDTRAEASVANESVFVCAPAQGIPVLTHTGGYATGKSGTSLAAPQVAAAAAIAKSINKDLTPTQFAEILKNSANRPDNQSTIPVRDTDIGYGILDMEAMIKYMLSGRKVYVSPVDESNSVTLFNLTDGQVSLSSIFGAYSSGNLADHSHEAITLPVNGSFTHTFGTTVSYEKIRHFMWKSLELATPYEGAYTPRELIK